MVSANRATRFRGATAIMLLLLPAAVLAVPVGVEFYNPTTGHYYQIVEGNYFEAEAASQALGGHLVTINDAAEQQWLVETFPMEEAFLFGDLGVETVVFYWIGLNWLSLDDPGPGPTAWNDGELFDPGSSYQNWAPLEPSGVLPVGDDFFREDFIAMNFRICDFAPDAPGCVEFANSSDAGLWNDFLGFTDTPYGIAEYKKVPEPGSLALLGLGLVGMGLRRRIKA